MSDTTRPSRRRGLKICCGATAIVLIAFIIAITTLSLTIFKIKQPEVTAHPTGLDHLNFSIFPLSINATLDMDITIHNRNYGGFKYYNSTAYLDFHEETVAEIPIGRGYVPARGVINITTSADVMGDKLVENSFFISDFETGFLNFTSTATLHGRVSLFKIIKFHAITVSVCDVSVAVATQTVESKCTSKIKF